MAPTIDVNADLGEGFGTWTLTDDEGLLDVVTSANVACGFHAGDPSTMRRVTAMAVERGVRIGAQVSYRDLVGFGRRPMDVPPAELRDEVLYQYGALEAIARVAGGAVAYLKPHGALYNRIVHDEAQASAVVEAVASVAPGSPVLTLPGSVFGRLAAEAGLAVVAEAFPDRGYRPDGTLLPRDQPDALVRGAEAIAERAVRLATDPTLRPRSLCLHGDSPGALEAARAVRNALDAAGIAVAAFA